MTRRFLRFSLRMMKFTCLFALGLPSFLCLILGCAVSEGPVPSGNPVSFPDRFRIDKVRDLKETLSGNEFVTTLPGVNPVFGESLTIRVRGLRVESVREKDPQKAIRAYDQWLAFKRALENARTIELRNLERGEGGFWVWADLYLDDRLVPRREG